MADDVPENYGTSMRHRCLIWIQAIASISSVLFAVSQIFDAEILECRLVWWCRVRSVLPLVLLILNIRLLLARNSSKVVIGLQPDMMSRPASPGGKRETNLRPRLLKDFPLRLTGFLMDEIDLVSDIDREDRYANGPFPQSWIPKGDIEKLLETLQCSGKCFISPVDMKDFLTLLHNAYSQPGKETDPSELYKRYGTFIKQIKSLTYGNRLFRTVQLSRTGLGSSGIRKKDVIFFATEYSAFLTLRPAAVEDGMIPEFQLSYNLVGTCCMGDDKYWRKVQPYLKTLRRVSIILEPDVSHILPSSVLRVPAQQASETGPHEDRNSNTRRSYAIDLSLGGIFRDKPIVLERGGKSIYSKLRVYKGNKKSQVTNMGAKRYIMRWKCTCGHRGIDQYFEHRPGAVHELLEDFQQHGIEAYIQACDPSQTRFAAYHIALRKLGISIVNLSMWARIRISVLLQYKEWPSPVAIRYDRHPDTVNDRSPSSKTATGPTSGGPSAHQNTNSNSHSPNQQAHAPSNAATVTSTTPAQPNWQPSSTATHTQANSTSINIREDFILLCMKVKRFLTTRHDLPVSAMTRDRELFQALRREYHSKFSWAYQHLSFQTVQRINFVTFTLHSRYEVDGLFADMPPETVTHYTCEPRKPGRVPALSNDFLMHRFSSPIDCFQDKICLKQFPKRVGERPTPGIDPDLYTGWGMHLEQGLDIQRISLVLFFGIASGGTFGLVWGICKSLQDGFAIASFIVGSEAVAVATIQILLTVGAM